MKKNIINALVYLIKAYLLIMLSSAILCGIVAYLIHSPFGTPGFAFMYATLIIPPLDIIVFMLLLFFHKYNNIEIIVESCLFTLGLIFLGFEGIIFEILLMLLIMGLYTIFKRIVINKHRDNGTT